MAAAKAHFPVDIDASADVGSIAQQRLAAKDLDDWEQQRVKRLPGESDGVL